MIRALEERYRRLLGWYPQSWRTKNSDVVVGTFLDVAEVDGRTYPTLRERGSVIAHGLTARMDRVIAPEVRNASSTIALTAGTGIALAELVMSSWAPWVTGDPAPESLNARAVSSTAGSFSPLSGSSRSLQQSPEIGESAARRLSPRSSSACYPNNCSRLPSEPLPLTGPR